jgi:hypothetical protein
MEQDNGRVPDGTGLSSPTEPQSSQGLGPTGFDPSRIMQEFYLSRYYEPKAERPADNVQAAIEFTIDHYLCRMHGLDPAERIGLHASRMLKLAPRAGVYVGIRIEPARDSDGSPKGGDACGSVHDSAGPKGIAQGLKP